MKLSDKIIGLRKSNGMSQEVLQNFCLVGPLFPEIPWC